MTRDRKPDKRPRDPVAIWDDILDLVAEDDAETAVATPDDARWAQEVSASVKSRLAALRRQLTPTHVSVRRGVEIPPEIQAMDHAALIARLEHLRQSPDVQYAHRDLTGLSDNDLRTMLAVLLVPKNQH